MSLLIETVAKEIILKEGRTGFTSGDIDTLHKIYDECIKRGMKPLHNTHPINILQRIRNGMRTKYLFDILVCSESILKRLSLYKLKER
jgi:hypothetical protein